MRFKILVLGLVFVCLAGFISAQLGESDVVYVAPGEKVFHMANCEKLGSVRTGMSVKHAVEVRGFEPCSECILSKGITLYRPPIHSTVLEDMQETRRAYVATKMGTISKRMGTAILFGNVLIGMTSEEVIASRGRPYSVNKTTGVFGVHEQWDMYATLDAPAWDPKAKNYGYLYFENGILTSWQSR